MSLYIDEMRERGRDRRVVVHSMRIAVKLSLPQVKKNAGLFFFYLAGSCTEIIPQDGFTN